MTKSYVDVQVVGGLGNQMFQFAAAKALAMQNNAELRMDISAFTNYKTWPYQLDLFNVQEALTTPETPSRLKKWFSNSAQIYQEPHFHFDENFFSLAGDNLYLRGYFQSFRYFEHIRSTLENTFTLRKPLTHSSQAWLKKFSQTDNSIAVHIRRGDYLDPQNQSIHQSVTLDYYHRAMSLMREICKQQHFFIFSDDAAYIHEHFSKLGDVTIVSSDNTPAHEEMLLMSQCQHNIIANSTFSWWGAWLNNNPQKIVCAPYQWFSRARQRELDPTDLYCPDWIIIK